MKKLMLLVMILLVILVGGCTQNTSEVTHTSPQPAQNQTMEELCIAGGGTVKTQQCCKSVVDFPNTCLVGGCGCSPENSHEIKVCDCGEVKCWNSTQKQCATLQYPIIT